jgi:hypothetical protein
MVGIPASSTRLTLLRRHRVLLKLDRVLSETSVSAGNDFHDRRREDASRVGPIEEEHMALHLTAELLKHQHLQEILKSEFTDADHETLEDTLEGLTELTEMIAFVLRSHLQDLALIRGLKGRIAEMQARVGRFERRAEKKRQVATSVMEQAEIRKVLEPDFTASLRRGSPPLLIVDEVRIPKEFWKPQPAKLDRQKLLAMLKAGQDVPGAVLGEAGCSLMMRTR